VNVTVLVAHPDDELMCAGTIAKYASDGWNEVNVVVFAFSDYGPDGQQEGVVTTNALPSTGLVLMCSAPTPTAR
jgi:LmbE family N-acetylglucosaminyl deacetylase